ncbi:hypothetical protein P5W99_10935 [Paraburkholderia sp. A3BS-1L]|uniref:hypothetical protein n=1 Tax=Paraburkholderia sp. A3BS-1L TaxID=3028375 RepID=UPI003DA98DB3
MKMAATHVELIRTFSKLSEQQDDAEDWARYFDARSGDLTWSDLHQQRVVVIVGEAGIGKTTEFRDEAERLRSLGKAAFFVELSQLAVNDSWNRAIGQSAPQFDAWKQSSEVGYFFLDAVDEARLINNAALKNALWVVRERLERHFSRVRIAISSRYTDWSIADVQAAVRDLLVTPIELACRPKPEATAEFQHNAIVVRFQEPEPKPDLNQPPDIFVASLSPLSLPEARKLADAWCTPDANGFWVAIKEGEYEHLATRPLDLTWMLAVWKEKRSLGTYRELLEGGVANRLKEVNPSYHASGTVPSLQQLRQGAELLAAATELCGRGYLSCEPSLTALQGEVAPQKVLDGWTGTEVSRLLASALFDEATFGRVKFHHRTTRGYLAACWIDRELQGGVLLHRVLPLFVVSPFDEPVLIPGRRWALCWLAAINATAREWVIAHFPEMLLFDGDPEAWDVLSADAAFAAYVRRHSEGFRPDWYNDAAELMRVGKRLSPGLVASYLADAGLEADTKVSLLPIVARARLMDCATAVFNLYTNPDAHLRERARALDTLAAVATTEQRAAIKADLVSGSLTSNEFIAAALVAIGAESLTVADLTSIFKMAGSEDEYGHGPMASAITDDLLPTSSVPSASAILEAVVACLPVQNGLGEFNKYHGPKPPRAWLLDVLPASLERLLSIFDAATEHYLAACLDAAVCIEQLRDTWYHNQDLQRIHGQIARHPNLRWQLALTLHNRHISHLTTRMCFSGCLVTFDAADLPGLTKRANDEHLPPAEREFWFDTAKEVAMVCLRRHARSAALAALIVGPDGMAHAERIAADRTHIAAALVSQRRIKVEQRQRENEMLAQRERNKERARADIDRVRDASHMGTLGWLVQYSHGQAGRDNIFRVDYGVIARDLGADIAEALAAGLKEIWQTTEPPDPADFTNGVVPGEAILALAGLYTVLQEGQDIGALDQNDTARAARLAVWELNRPSDWFIQLAEADGSTVEEALRPWIDDEAHQEHSTSHTRRALDLALRCHGSVRARLLQPLVPAVLTRRIPSPRTFKELFGVLREDGLIVSGAVENLCRTLLNETREPDGLLRDPDWLRVWLEESPRPAWAWFEENLSTDDATARIQVKQFVETLSDFKWIRIPADDSTVDVLLQLHALVSKHRSAEDAASERRAADFFAPSMSRALETLIPGIFAQTPGNAAHQALLNLVSREMDPMVKTGLKARVQEHAARQASLTSHLEPADLLTLGALLHREPENERELFEQVLARLEEVQIGVEQGPFSDRRLFHAGMPEKLLQLWLAARFRDTPNRRFSVHREEEVDDDKETDIQLSARNWNVCIEVKPVDHRRGYSAASLTSTLRDQLVGQYLKGFNSGHGILVLFQLDNKAWDIPGAGKGQSFQALVEYLQRQAQLIKVEQPHVQELIVFAINCTLPNAAAETDIPAPNRAVKNATTKAATTAHMATRKSAKTTRKAAAKTGVKSKLPASGKAEVQVAKKKAPKEKAAKKAAVQEGGATKKRLTADYLPAKLPRKR